MPIMEDIENTLKELRNLINSNIEELSKMIEEEKTRKIPKNLRYWEMQYKGLSKQKINNNLKLIEIQSRSKDCDDKIDFIYDIIKEYGKKKNDKIHLDYLEKFLDVE